MKHILILIDICLLPLFITAIFTLAISYSCSYNCFKTPLPYFVFFISMFGYVCFVAEEKQKAKAAKKSRY